MARVALFAAVLATGVAGDFACGLRGVRADERSRDLTPVPDPGLNVDYRDQVLPLLKKYCWDCHQGDEANAGVMLDRYGGAEAARQDRKTWQRVFDQLRVDHMPPEDEPRPSDDERTQILGWIQSHVLKVDCKGPVSPGRVTIRRLNRVEYNNTVRDLLGVDLQLADDFPADDVGYGFDNIGDVLSLPPVLLERYLDAADKIVHAAIVGNDPQSPPFAEAKGRLLSKNGETAAEFEFPVTGKYVLQAHASADQAGPEPARMTLRLDGRELATFDVKGNRDELQVYELRVGVEKGLHRFAAEYINNYYKPDDPDPAKRGDRNLYVAQLAATGPFDVHPDDYPETHKCIFVCSPAVGSSEEERSQCAVAILRRFATRAYRRPATDDEVDRLVRLANSAQSNGDTFERAIQLAVQAVLVSPHFLFRVELDPAGDETVRDLNDYELATRLSYFLWSSMPDEELFHLAESGTLREGNNLDAQVQRMLKSPKSESLVKNFAGQWLGLRKLAALEPDRGRFPEFDDKLRQAMIAETELFFEAIVREDRSVLDLLDADFTFANERLAKHYGIADVTGPEFRRVSLDRSQRGGILGHASILTVTSNPTRTSPVKRGKWILENLLAAPPPPAPPNVPELEAPGGQATSGTLRQRMEQHRQKAACAACHELMDPLGFGLENYDGIGGWRTNDGEFPIDAGGTLPGGESFNGPAELREILKNRRDDFRFCLIEKMLTYALGRGLEYDDSCTVEQIAGSLAADGDRFSVLVREIVHSVPFQMQAARRTSTEPSEQPNSEVEP